MGDVCLRAGRICASTATGKETADLRMEDPLDSVTDDQLETRSAKCFAATLSLRLGTVILVMGSFAMAKRKQPKKHRRRNVGQSLGASESPDALSIAEDRIRIRPKGATGTRRSARPLARGRECKARRRPRAVNNRGDDACLKSSGCLTVESEIA